jgi:hypothetical protein
MISWTQYVGVFVISHYSYSIYSEREYLRKIPLMLIIYVTISTAVSKLYCNIINQIKLLLFVWYFSSYSYYNFEVTLKL